MEKKEKQSRKHSLCSGQEGPCRPLACRLRSEKLRSQTKVIERTGWCPKANGTIWKQEGIETK